MMKKLLIILLFVGVKCYSQSPVTTRVVLKADTTSAPAGVKKVTLVANATTPGAGVTKATLKYDTIPGSFMYFFPFKLN